MEENKLIDMLANRLMDIKLGPDIQLCHALADILNTDFVLIYWQLDANWYISSIYYFGETIVLDVIDSAEPGISKYQTSQLGALKKITLVNSYIIFNDNNNFTFDKLSLFIIDAKINMLIHHALLVQINSDYHNILTSVQQLQESVKLLLNIKSIRKLTVNMSINICDIIDCIKLRTNQLVLNITTVSIRQLISSICDNYYIDDSVNDDIETDHLRFKQLLMYIADKTSIIVVSSSDSNLIFDVKPNHILSDWHLSICNMLSLLLRCTIAKVSNVYIITSH